MVDTLRKFEKEYNFRRVSAVNICKPFQENDNQTDFYQTTNFRKIQQNSKIEINVKIVNMCKWGGVEVLRI